MFGDAVTDEDRICDADETVVDAVGVDVGDVTGLKVGENSMGGVGRGERCAKGGVESAVPVWRHGHSGFRIKKDFAIHGETRQCT